MTLGDVILISCIITTWIIMLIALITIFIFKASDDVKTKVVIHKHKYDEPEEKKEETDDKQQRDSTINT